MEEEKMKMWSNLESATNYILPINLKNILSMSGFDSVVSLKYISQQTIVDTEKYIAKNLLYFQKCLNSDDPSTVAYKKQRSFEILPGHKAILLALPDIIKNIESQNNIENALADNIKKYPIILKKLVESFEKNKNMSKHANHYDDVLKCFATYIFMLCGRTCYETICKNLPIPSIKTIRKCNSFHIYFISNLVSNSSIKLIEIFNQNSSLYQR